MLKPITGVIIALMFALAIVCLAYVCADVENKSIENTQLITLPDNSDVLLEKNSSINYNHLGWLFNREIKLTGNALFNVKQKHDFIVETENAKVIALKTQFYISQHQNKLWVECYEGTVLVKTEDGKVLVEKNERLYYQPGAIIQKESLFHGKPEVYRPQVLKELLHNE